MQNCRHFEENKLLSIGKSELDKDFTKFNISVRKSFTLCLLIKNWGGAMVLGKLPVLGRPTYLG